MEQHNADELIILELEGRASADQRKELRQWREALEDNERRYQDVRALWALTAHHKEVDPTLEVPESATLLRRGRWTGYGRGRWLHRAAAVAAAVVITLGVGYLATEWIESRRVVVSEHRSGADELATAALHDGSVARLAPNTTLHFRSGPDHREVDLDGRAFFAVASDPDRPFRVRTSKGEARVLGTRFEIGTGGDTLRVLVVDGSVALSTGGMETELGAGEVGEASSTVPLTITRVEVPEEHLGWLGAWVAFEATPLRQVARELEARLDLRVEITDPAIAERTISGWFSHEDRSRMLSMICRVADVRCTEADGVVRMWD